MKRSPWGAVYDLSGMVFGRLTVIRMVTPANNEQVYICKCSCGNEILVKRKYLIDGHKQSCGCFQRESRHKRLKDITGNRYGRLVVLGQDLEYNKNHAQKRWICKCDCGNIVKVFSFNLKRNNTASCGCYAREATSQTHKKDITGQRFGRLIAIRPYTGIDTRKITTSTLWECKCDCGNITVADISNLMNGHTRSCGCLIADTITTHGVCKTEVGRHLMNIHTNMIRRCYNPKDHSYSNYGGRGIYICDEWYTPDDKYNSGVLNFYNWSIENGYEIGLSIDRIDNDGPYAPWNCRWVTTKVQANNRQTTKYIVDADGERLTYALFDEKHGLPRNFTSHAMRHWDANAHVHCVNHPELKMRISYKTKEYVDKDGFVVLIPNYEKRYENGWKKI